MESFKIDHIFNHHARLAFLWSSQLNLNNIFKETTDQYLKFFILEKRNLLTLQHGLYQEGSKGGGEGERSPVSCKIFGKCMHCVP